MSKPIEIIERTIRHLTWMIETLKVQRDDSGIGGGYSEELTDAISLLTELQPYRDGSLITNRTRIDLLRLANLLNTVAGKGELSTALLEDLKEDGVSLAIKD